jgi:hypothetical protein
MTVEQYLHRSFEVEPDYLDGELVERHVGARMLLALWAG